MGATSTQFDNDTCTQTQEATLALFDHMNTISSNDKAKHGVPNAEQTARRSREVKSRWHHVRHDAPRRVVELVPQGQRMPSLPSQPGQSNDCALTRRTRIVSRNLASVSAHNSLHLYKATSKEIMEAPAIGHHAISWPPNNSRLSCSSSSMW